MLLTFKLIIARIRSASLSDFPITVACVSVNDQTSLFYLEQKSLMQIDTCLD